MSVDASARAAEACIDHAYLEEPLLRRDRANALFHVLLEVERQLDRIFAKPPQKAAVKLDTLVDVLKYAVAWAAAADGSKVTDECDFEDACLEARRLIAAAGNYMFFVIAYTHGSRDVIDVTLRGRHVRVARTLVDESRYEAYNMLQKRTLEERHSSAPADDRIQAEAQRAARRGVIPPSIPLVRRVLDAAFQLLHEASEPLYVLPRDWQFEGFTLREFRLVHDVIRSIVYVWRHLSPVVRQTGIQYMPDFPYVVGASDMKAAVKAITSLPAKTITQVLDHLTYGALGIKKPDPAIQPLIMLPSGSYMLSTPLILGSAPERNLSVLLNALPNQRRIYAALTQDKESMMRNRIVQRLPGHLAIRHGRIHPAFPDVDLMVADAEAEALLLIELKWFIDPAEAREIDERSDELEKGVGQCKKLLTALQRAPDSLKAIVPFEVREVAAIVVSANWIGLGNVQDAAIPIVNEDHFIAAVRAAGGLGGLIPWLRSRDYLPREGEHFRTEWFGAQFGGYTIDWYGLEPIQTEAPTS